jgi:anaerobic selenocysteine-containing dehydrogenase
VNVANDTVTTKTFCAMCIARCGAVATVRDGRFSGLGPDPSHPTGQALCAKGRAAPELVYSPDRILFPMKRSRPKDDADPGWQRISWDEALDTTAAAMLRIANKHGPEAMAFSQASPSTTGIGDAGGWIRRLMNAFGTPNLCWSLELCGWGRGFATRYTYGVGSVALGASGAMADIAHTGCLVLWGYNPSMTRLTHATAALKAVERGAKLIVIDPRHVGLAGKADIWLRVRPGTDGALALGLAHIMIERGWYDRDFIRDWSNGPLLVRADTGRLLTGRDLGVSGEESHRVAWDEAARQPVLYEPATGRYQREDAAPALEGAYTISTETGDVQCHPAFELYVRLCRRHTPEAVEATCWIGRDQLEQTARVLWESGPVSYYAWSGHEHHANTTQTARAMSLLYALTGSFDTEGGNVLFPVIPNAAVTGEDLPAAKQMKPALGLAERPLGTARWGSVTARELYTAVLEERPYPVRGLIGFGANTLVAHNDALRGREALRALDFHAHVDMFMNPTAELADIIMPAASPFERDGLRFGFEISAEAQSLVQFRTPLVPPQGESRSDTEIVFELAKRLGLGAQFWDGDIEAAYRHQLAPSGVTLDALRAAPGGVKVGLNPRYCKYSERDAAGVAAGFATPSRKVELYSETFLNHGYAPLPAYVEPPMGPIARPDLAGRYGLVLTSAKNTLFCNGQHRGLPSLRKRAIHPEIELHPDTAMARGIAAGAWVVIDTPAGSARAKARLNASLDPRVAVGQHGWWQACAALAVPSADPFSAEGTNFNLLIGSEWLDPVSGTAPHKSYLCDIRPVD